MGWFNGQNNPNVGPQGTWNLYWCSDTSHMWCDCEIGKMWKNSTLSNPKFYSHYGQLWSTSNPNLNSCGCHLFRSGRCVGANFGEMESVTCHLCTPQNQEGAKNFRNAYFPCVDQLV